MRTLEERLEFSNGIREEWGPYTGEVNTRGWTDAQFRAFVREQNRLAKQTGSCVRVRSVDDETDGQW